MCILPYNGFMPPGGFELGLFMGRVKFEGLVLIFI